MCTYNFWIQRYLQSSFTKVMYLFVFSSRPVALRFHPLRIQSFYRNYCTMWPLEMMPSCACLSIICNSRLSRLCVCSSGIACHRIQRLSLAHRQRLRHPHRPRRRHRSRQVWTVSHEAHRRVRKQTVTISRHKSIESERAFAHVIYCHDSLFLLRMKLLVLGAHPRRTWIYENSHRWRCTINQSLWMAVAALVPRHMAASIIVHVRLLNPLQL